MGSMSIPVPFQPREPGSHGASLALYSQDVGVDPDHKDPTTRIYLTRVAQPYHVDSADVVGAICVGLNA